METLIETRGAPKLGMVQAQSPFSGAKQSIKKCFVSTISPSQVTGFVERAQRPFYFSKSTAAHHFYSTVFFLLFNRIISYRNKNNVNSCLIAH